jgi:hexosaminidase
MLPGVEAPFEGGTGKCSALFSLMRRRAFVAALASGFATFAAAQAPAIVPNPASIEPRAGAFALSAATPVVVDAAAARRVALVFADLVQRSNGIKLQVRAGTARDGAVNLRLDTRGGLAPEAYHLEVSPARIAIVAATPAGLVHGATTLWQMIAPGKRAVAIPAVAVDDAPRFAWRGIMLDSARHYQSPEFILRFIDAMALNKLNVLHWHLTDDQAWRLEIRKYPRLTSVGAWRVPAGPAALADLDPASGRPRRYGGYYSQQAVRRIVAYAALRGITVVPEIEMPGHASAAIAAYPRLAAAHDPPTQVPADWGIYPNVYSLEDSTFGFLEDVLTEVMALFPGRYIHVGGDEVEKTQWKDSARGQALLAALGSDDGARLQVYFTQRIARFLEARGRRLVGWDEILEPGLPASAVVMSWRGVDGALKAASQGYDTVLAAYPTLYFDNRQSTAASEPPGRARVVSLEDVYRFEPMPAALAPDERRHVLGLQGNVWTEHIRTEERVGWMTFPRAAAIAELGWSQPERRDWDDFTRRLAAQPARYEALGIAYAKSAFASGAAVPAGARRMSQELTLCSDNIALSLEDDAPIDGPRATFLVDIQNPCWIVSAVDFDRTPGLIASVGQVPFNFQIGADIRKIAFPAPTTPEGELEAHLGTCDGPIVARMPLAPAVKSQAVTTLPRAPLRGVQGRGELCLRFAQPRLDPLWVIDSIELVEARP